MSSLEALRIKRKMDALVRMGNYDVCLSFEVGGTRTGFAHFLYNGLVRVFRVEDELRLGEQIGAEHLKAIRGCRIAIPIISEDYARCRRCLRELAEIMDCHRKHGQLVFPIFYKVDAVDVDRQRGNIEEALREHERKYSSEEVLKWREALTSVARIRGWTSQAIADGGEAELVQLERERVSSELRRMWIEQLPMIIRSVYLHLAEEQRRESECQVFLAFHAVDARYEPAAYPRTALVAAGIRVFNDDDLSLIGKDDAGEIGNAIGHSKMSILMFSENFTTSRWCPEYLAQIVDCKRTKVLPIFYKVKPSQVQDALHCFPKNLLLEDDEVLMSEGREL